MRCTCLAGNDEASDTKWEMGMSAVVSRCEGRSAQNEIAGKCEGAPLGNMNRKSLGEHSQIAGTESDNVGGIMAFSSRGFDENVNGIMVFRSRDFGERNQLAC